MFVCLFVCGQRGRVITLSIHGVVDTKISTLSETGQFMSSTYYVRVNSLLLHASRTRAYFRKPRKADFSTFLASSKVDFNLDDLSLKRLLPQSNLGD